MAIRRSRRMAFKEANAAKPPKNSAMPSVKIPANSSSQSIHKQQRQCYSSLLLQEPLLPDCDGRPWQRPLLFLVEGRYDIEFLTILSQNLHQAEPKIPDLASLISAKKLLFIPTGGNPQLWTDRLAALNCPEIHLYDRESAAETTIRKAAAQRVNARPNSWAYVTSKRSLENFLHPAAIEAAGGGKFAYGDFDDIGELIAHDWYQRAPQSIAWCELPSRARSRFVQRAKKWLNTVAVRAMTADLLRERDPQGDLVSVFKAVRTFCLSGQ